MGSWGADVLPCHKHQAERQTHCREQLVPRVRSHPSICQRFLCYWVPFVIKAWSWKYSSWKYSPQQQSYPWSSRHWLGAVTNWATGDSQAMSYRFIYSVCDACPATLQRSICQVINAIVGKFVLSHDRPPQAWNCCLNVCLMGVVSLTCMVSFSWILACQGLDKHLHVKC